MKARRRYVLAIGAAAIAAPIVSLAQQQPMPRVGCLISETLSGQASRIDALRAGCATTGPKEFAVAGGLFGYGIDDAEMYHHAAYFVDRIIKGAKPAELPIEQPTKLKLVINLRTAKGLGIAIPQSLLLRADEVIE